MSKQLTFALSIGLSLALISGASAMTVPTSDDMRAWASYGDRIPSCGQARKFDDYAANPKAVSLAAQGRRIHAYVLCRSELHNAHAGANVGNVNAFFLGRACMIYALIGGSAATMPDCD